MLPTFDQDNNCPFLSKRAMHFQLQSISGFPCLSSFFASLQEFLTIVLVIDTENKIVNLDNCVTGMIGLVDDPERCCHKHTFLFP
jgi:hypothetical protein